VSFDRPQISILDARLAEIDKRLRTIQTGLADEPADLVPPRPSTPEPVLPRRVEVTEAPAPVDPPAPIPAAEADAGELVSQLSSLACEHERLLDSLRALAQPERRASPVAAPIVGLSVGPLASTEALRSFERALARLPGVAAVELRGFEGGDRALLDVHLGR
jgi:hypothetical protein